MYSFHDIIPVHLSLLLFFSGSFSFFQDKFFAQHGKRPGHRILWSLSKIKIKMTKKKSFYRGSLILRLMRRKSSPSNNIGVFYSDSLSRFDIFLGWMFSLACLLRL